MRTVELKKKLQQSGCYFIANGKNHEWWFSPITNQRFQVPRHANEDIRTQLKKQISKQSGVIL
ncbi:MAG: type II toxin-antitoxin system HicA family toxin [Bacteroidales bacterium]|nr:type II toxin-antitoxin system HicA family toxin [Bacteroidales bacterium]